MTVTAGQAQESPAAAPHGLLCDLMTEPERVEITHATPRFSWIVPTTMPGDMQRAYRIRVASDAADLTHTERCLWDSGRVVSDRSVAVPYAGSPLASHHVYVWAVQTWNKQNQPSVWSTPQRFRTGAIGTETSDSKGTRTTATPYPIVQTPILPAAVDPIGDNHYFLDFGRAAFAGLRLTLTSAAGGERVVVHLGEAREAGAKRVNRAPGGSIRYHHAEITLQPGTHAYDVPLGPKDARRMPPAIGPVMPFRYVEVENCPSPLTRVSAVQLTAHYPFDDNAARFECSDAALNRVWDLCHYTMKATSFCGIFVDGDRERLPYEADAYINQLGWYVSDREFLLPRYTHEYLIQHPTWPTEWFLQSVLIAWHDYLYTGDDRSLAAFYNELQAKTLDRLARPDGLISTTKPRVPADVAAALHHQPTTRGVEDIVDWPPAERDGYEMRPVNTVVNAFHCEALARMADIAAALSKKDDAARYREASARAARSFNEKLFDTAAGLYRDGEGSEHHSLHANVFPLAFGLVPPEHLAKVATFVRSRGMACSVYGAQFLMEALYRSGQGEYARGLMTAPGDRSWRHMAEDVGTTMTLEAWDQKYKPNQDWNHAWGAAPANVIPRLLMGVEPTEPGFRRLRIRPQPGGLERASLDLPTIRGTVHVDFVSTPERFTLNVRLLANTAAEVRIPALDMPGSVVLEDGERRHGRRDGDEIVLENVGSGLHTFVREKATP